MKELSSLYKKELKALYDALKGSCDTSVLKALALAFARINYRLNDSYTELSDIILQRLYPALFRYIPALSVVQLKGLNGAGVKKGTLLKVFSQNRHYIFKTVYSVTFAPIQVSSILFLNQQSNKSLLKIFCTILSDDKSSIKQKLRFYINTDFETACELYELIFNQLSTLSIKIEGHEKAYTLEPHRISPVGLNLKDSLLVDSPILSSAEQLLQEFFVFPYKFLFFDIDLSSLPLEWQVNSFELVFKFNRTAIVKKINTQSLLLNCTPIINLFDHFSEYITLYSRREWSKVIYSEK
jgi:type VI secretion system protein ImpG